MTSRRDHDAQTAAAAAIARATAHVPPAGEDWPDPIPVDPELHHRYPVTPEVARAIRLHLEETRNAQLR